MRTRAWLPALALALAGCAAPGGDLDYDPWEPMNRKVFWFNERLDEYVLEPAARGWESITSASVRRGFSRFFANLGFPVNLVNNLLQGKLEGALDETARFVVNTTVGILGFRDPATDFGIEASEEDFGQTLAVWGVPAGPYLVLPFWGPSNPRDTTGLVGDFVTNRAAYGVEGGVVIAANAVSTVNSRAQLLEQIENARAAALDFYVFVRNAYLQRRRALADDADISDEERESFYYLAEEDEDDLYYIEEDDPDA